MITDDTPPHDSARDYCLDAIGHGCFACDLDGHVHGFVPSVRDRLIERGVLRQRTDTCWYLAWHGVDLDREKAADMACCDFCTQGTREERGCGPTRASGGCSPRPSAPCSRPSGSTTAAARYAFRRTRTGTEPCLTRLGPSSVATS